MDKINEILKNKKYIECLNEIEKLEKDRKFCRHNMNHFLDVARIAYILVLEKGLNYSKDVIYAVGLLHDIGRGEEYKTGVNHDDASAEIAEEILRETSYTDDEKKIILKAILSHGTDGSEDEFQDIIYKSDKLSRNCFKCHAEKECYWSKEKKNIIIKY
ncbi:HD domain-containing protein [uncultured Clostridium sp.]|uniref:HD domain-containing protein n=1 Tax=uncultured Clostridium sp. TaxID=59620 RepID=UPI0025FE4822|nr:HD domain-containing protein [uncultured Clostridium sp.]